MQGQIETDSSGINEKMKMLEVRIMSLTALKEQICDLKSTAADIEIKATHLQDKVDELENSSRRNNLIIYGIKEERDETTETLTARVVETVF